MAEATILHLSDLHMDKGHFKEIKIILDALFDDLKGLKDENKKDLKPDMVFFTGDLVNSGSNYDEFGLAREEFIKKLLLPDILSLPEERFFFVSGNHDIDRNKWDEIVIGGIRTKCTDSGKLNNFFDTKLDLNSDKYLETLHNFIAFKNNFNNKPVETNNLFSVHQMNLHGVKFGIGCLNSAWLAFGGDDDRGKLLVGERQVDGVLDEMGPYDVKIALMHHPLEWLTGFDSEEVENRITQGFDLFFTGHMHQNKPKSFRWPNGSLFYSDGGTLFSGDRKKDYQGYTILKLDTQSKEVNTVYFRRYIDSRKKFDKDVDIADDGCWQPNLGKKKQHNPTS